ncbi:MAG: helix-turn-helix domain-containing protein [Gaiellaceae bacterium]
MLDPDVTASQVIALSDAIAQHAEHHEVGLATIARRSGMTLTYLETLADGETFPIEAEAVEAVARVLGLEPSRVREYRAASVMDSLSRRSARLDALFSETLSPIERNLVADAKFSEEPFGPTVWRLLGEHELTQQELAEGIGLAQSSLSRAMNGHERPSIELLETVAQALDVAPEIFVEYRLGLIDDWLRQHPGRTDELFEELSWEPMLAGYHAWRVRTLPDPRHVEPRALLESLLEIVAAEGPVMGARVYGLRLAAAGLEETRDLRSLLNRGTAALARAGRLIDENETGEQTQKYRILRLPDQAAVVPRVLGDRRLWQVPPRELETVIRATSAWKRGLSVARVQMAVTATYGLSGVSLRDAEHLNRCITRSAQGGNA